MLAWAMMAASTPVPVGSGLSCLHTADCNLTHVCVAEAPYRRYCAASLTHALPGRSLFAPSAEARCERCDAPLLLVDFALNVTPGAYACATECALPLALDAAAAAAAAAQRDAEARGADWEYGEGVGSAGLEPSATALLDALGDALESTFGSEILERGAASRAVSDSGANGAYGTSTGTGGSFSLEGVVSEDRSEELYPPPSAPGTSQGYYRRRLLETEDTEDAATDTRAPQVSTKLPSGFAATRGDGAGEAAASAFRSIPTRHHPSYSRSNCVTSCTLRPVELHGAARLTVPPPLYSADGFEPSSVELSASAASAASAARLDAARALVASTAAALADAAHARSELSMKQQRLAKEAESARAVFEELEGAEAAAERAAESASPALRREMAGRLAAATARREAGAAPLAEAEHRLRASLEEAPQSSVDANPLGVEANVALHALAAAEREHALLSEEAARAGLQAVPLDARVAAQWMGSAAAQSEAAADALANRTGAPPPPPRVPSHGRWGHAAVESAAGGVLELTRAEARSWGWAIFRPERHLYSFRAAVDVSMGGGTGGESRVRERCVCVCVESESLLGSTELVHALESWPPARAPA